MKISRALSFAGLVFALTVPSILTLSPARADVGGACLAAAHANASLKSYRAVMTTSYGGKTTVSTVDLVKPDRFHVTQPAIEIIAIGNRAWRRMGSGPWQTMPGMKVADLFATSQIKFSHSTTCVDGGMGLWHGQPAHLFKSTSTVNGKASQGTIYVMSDGFVHHMDMTASGDHFTMDFLNLNTATVKPPG